MKLLICTQRVDLDDPILGFFHGWIIEFAKRFESVVVIALGVGRHELPANVRVLSLGKDKLKTQKSLVTPAKAGVHGPTTEDGDTLDSGFRRNDKKNLRLSNRLRYAVRFKLLLWKERANYDTVFVHMNEEYVLIGGPLWKLLGKEVLMWRNHRMGSFLTRVAVALSDKVMTTSPQSFTAKFKKAVFMPAGIDTIFFHKKPEIIKKNDSVLYLGRLSPVKKIEVIIRAVAQLRKESVPVSLTIIGDPTPVDAEYARGLKSLVNDLNVSDAVEFKPAVPNYEAINEYNSYLMSVNATPGGSLDKTIFEAMACEQLVVTSNGALAGELDSRLIFGECDPGALAAKIRGVLSMNDDERAELGRKLRDIVVERHSLSSLVEKVAKMANHER